MSTDGSSGAANAALGVSMGGGIVATINEYAVLIGLGLSLLSLIIGLYFHIQTVRWRKQQDEKDRDDLREELMCEIESLKTRQSESSK